MAEGATKDEYDETVRRIVAENRDEFRKPDPAAAEAIQGPIMEFVMESGAEGPARILEHAPDSCVAAAGRIYVARDPDKASYDGVQVMRQLAYGAMAQHIATLAADGVFRRD